MKEDKQKGAINSTHDFAKNQGKDTNFETIKSIDNEIQERTISELEKRIKNAKIDPFKKLMAKPSVLSIDGVSYGSLGNFSCITGKSKSRKTFFLSMLMAAALDNDGKSQRIKTDIPNKKVIHFDTEQSEYHTQLVSKRVIEQVGSNEYIKNYDCYFLRPFSPSERIEIIEAVIYKENNLGLVIIDGVADLCIGYNDEREASKTVGKLLKWTGELNIHIITVIHQNKADSNTKGHLGGHINQKSETVISVEKDNDISNVATELSRGIEINKLSFSINEDGLPFLVDYIPNNVRNGKTTPREIQKTEHKTIIKNAFDEQEEKLSRTNLLARLKWALELSNYPNGDDKCKEFLNFYKDENYIIQEGNNKPYSLNKDMVG